MPESPRQPACAGQNGQITCGRRSRLGCLPCSERTLGGPVRAPGTLPGITVPDHPSGALGDVLGAAQSRSGLGEMPAPRSIAVKGRIRPIVDIPVKWDEVVETAHSRTWFPMRTKGTSRPGDRPTEPATAKFAVVPQVCPGFGSLGESQPCNMEVGHQASPKNDERTEPLANGQTTCNCTMEATFCDNESHDDACDLWIDSRFIDGSVCWDPNTNRLITSPIGLNVGLSTIKNPYENAEDFIWDGDTPIISKSAAARRAGELGLTDPDNPYCASEPNVPDQEDEVNAAIIAGAEVDEYGWVRLSDGSWADQENRVTYRQIKDDDGQDCWVEELWDDTDMRGLDPLPPVREGTPDCICPTSKMYWCTQCGVTRDKADDAWRWQTAADIAEYDNDWSYWTNGCGHVMNAVKLSDAVTVYASGVRKHSDNEDYNPDFGIYAYGGWNPAMPAIFIPWQDYGLPTCSYTKAARSIQTAFRAAVEGQEVEVGCMGGHGRTGTILACMYILANPTATGPEAVKAVQRLHCTKAVETGSQEWFVRWFRAWANGETFTEPEVKGFGFTSSAKGAASYESSLSTHGDVIHCTIKADGTMEEIYADGTIVTTFNSTAEETTTGGSTYAGPKVYKGGTTSQTGGVSTKVASGDTQSKWCSGCMRSVILYHNNDCPFDQPEPYRMPQNDGNTAPGATANQRRKAARRARKQDQRRRQARQGASR